jgi:hypothetical protein
MDLQQDTNPVTEAPATTTDLKSLFSFQSYRENYPGTPGNFLAGMSEGLHDEQPDFLQDLAYEIQDETDIPLYQDVTRILKVGLKSKSLMAKDRNASIMEIVFETTARDINIGTWRELHRNKVATKVIGTRMIHYNNKFYGFLTDMRWPGMPIATMSFLEQREQYQAISCSKGPGGRGFVIHMIRNNPSMGWDHVSIHVNLENLLDYETLRRYLKSVKR